MEDELLAAISSHSVKVSMTRRQARIFYEIISKALKEQESICETTDQMHRMTHADVAATDLQSIHESLYFDAGLSESLDFEAGLGETGKD